MQAATAEAWQGREGEESRMLRVWGLGLRGQDGADSNRDGEGPKSRLGHVRLEIPTRHPPGRGDTYS